MSDWIGNHLGIIEMLMSGFVVLGFCAWQYWSVRDTGKPPEEGE